MTGKRKRSRKKTKPSKSHDGDPQTPSNSNQVCFQLLTHSLRLELPFGQSSVITIPTLSFYQGVAARMQREDEEKSAERSEASDENNVVMDQAANQKKKTKKKKRKKKKKKWNPPKVTAVSKPEDGKVKNWILWIGDSLDQGRVSFRAMGGRDKQLDPFIKRSILSLCCCPDSAVFGQPVFAPSWGSG